MDVGSNQKPVVATPKTPKFTTDLQRRITVRVAPYAYKQHIKVPKHFEYIQYGCGIQSEDWCSLSFDIMTSHWLTGLQSTPKKFQNPPPTCRGVSLQGWPHMHRQHIKVLKHFVYIQYGCGIQSEDCCSLSFDIMTSHRLTGLHSLPTKIQNPPPTCRGVSLQGWPNMPVGSISRC